MPQLFLVLPNLIETFIVILRKYKEATSLLSTLRIFQNDNLFVNSSLSPTSFPGSLSSGKMRDPGNEVALSHAIIQMALSVFQVEF